MSARALLRSGIALVALSMLSLSCSAGSGGDPLTVEYFSISQTADGTIGGDCYASKDGTSVIVKDGSGEIVGTGRVGVGTWEAHPDGRNHNCVHRATVDLDEADFYVVSIEGLGGALTYSHDELVSNGWRIAIG